MPNTTNKLHINDTVLFKQVASVLGKGRALEELLRAYRDIGCRGGIFRWEGSICNAFLWQTSPQGNDFWRGVVRDYNSQILNR